MQVQELVESIQQFSSHGGVRGLFTSQIKGEDVTFEAKYFVNVEFDHDIGAVVIVADGGYKISDSINPVISKTLTKELKQANLDNDEIINLLEEYDEDDLVVVRAYVNMNEDIEEFYIIENLEYQSDTDPDTCVILGEIE